MDAKEHKAQTAPSQSSKPEMPVVIYKVKSSAPIWKRPNARQPQTKKGLLVSMISAEIKNGTYDAIDQFDTAMISLLAKAMTRILPTDHLPEEQMAAKAGPFYQTSTLVDWLGVTRQALDKRAAKRELLAVQDAEGRKYYPDRQFTDDGTVVSGLREVLDTLAEGTPFNWTWALWLSGASGLLSGRTGWEALSDGDRDLVIRAARRDAARWAA